VLSASSTTRHLGYAVMSQSDCRLDNVKGLLVLTDHRIFFSPCLGNYRPKVSLGRKAGRASRPSTVGPVLSCDVCPPTLRIAKPSPWRMVARSTSSSVKETRSRQGGRTLGIASVRMNYQVGATQTKLLEDRGLPLFRPRSSVTIPVGTIHAVPVGSTDLRSLCGLGPLKIVPGDFEQPRSFVRTCPDCQARIPALS
jgi:hypothetical protein